MALEVVTPQLGNVRKPAKDLVISVLAYEYPLTIAKLKNSIVKKFGASVTFQGVRKAVNQLAEDGVVEKNGRDYCLSREWIMRLRDFIETLQESYLTERKSVLEVESIGDDIKVYTFENVIDLDVFWNRIIAGWFDASVKKPGKKSYLQRCGHAWYVMANLEEETDIIDKIGGLGIQFYTVVSGNTVLDRWCKRYYEEHGFHYAMGGGGKSSQYFAVFDDFIIQCDYPEELARQIDNVYNRAKDFESFEVTKLIKLLRKKTALKITVMKNPVVAEQLRNHVLSYFKRK